MIARAAIATAHQRDITAVNVQPATTPTPGNQPASITRLPGQAIARPVTATADRLIITMGSAQCVTIQHPGQMPPSATISPPIMAMQTASVRPATLLGQATGVAITATIKQKWNPNTQKKKSLILPVAVLNAIPKEKMTKQMLKKLFKHEWTRRKTLASGYVVPDPSRCVQCGICSYSCPIEIDVRRHAWIGMPVKDSHCLTCGECVARCPRGVLRFERTPIFQADGEAR